MNQSSRFYRTAVQTIELAPFDTPPGWILDLGGGGEGVIGQMFGPRVVAIDRLREELLEAPAGPLKIVMDATALQFLDSSFDTLTAFFSLMFLQPEQRAAVFAEALRVMRPGAIWHIWDAVIPPFPGGEQDIYIIKLDIRLPDRAIDTGYGALWPGHEQDGGLYAQLAREAGFIVRGCQQGEHIFTLQLEKPHA